MTPVTKDSEGTWLSPPGICDKRWSAPRIIFLWRAAREEREEDRWFSQAKRRGQGSGLKYWQAGKLIWLSSCLYLHLRRAVCFSPGPSLPSLPPLPPSLPCYSQLKWAKFRYQSNYELKLKTVSDREGKGGVCSAEKTYERIWREHDLDRAPPLLWRLQFYVKTGGNIVQWEWDVLSSHSCISYCAQFSPTAKAWH